MMSKHGRLYIIDIIHEKLKDKIVFHPEKDTQDKKFIVDAKLENAFNTLVFRTWDQRFYYVDNVISGLSPLVLPTPFTTPFKAIKFSESTDSESEIDFAIIPKQQSKLKKKKIELFVTDPVEGFHYVNTDGDPTHYRSRNQLDPDDEDEKNNEAVGDGEDELQPLSSLIETQFLQSYR